MTWRVDDQPTSAELRLFWYTSGKGTQDVGVVNTMTFAAPRTDDHRDFTLPLPREPYSFSGTLISLIWAIELIVEPGEHVERREIVLSATGEEVVLGAMKARDNPFGVARVLSAIRYRAPRATADDGRDRAVSLLPRLEALRYRAAIVGPHGSGKTTLLEDLEGVLAERGFRITARAARHRRSAAASRMAVAVIALAASCVSTTATSSVSTAPNSSARSRGCDSAGGRAAQAA